ncbi:MAG: AraC family transcriptional regulator [Bacillota bacterium]|nr:AraC family transcriptional regulator [Bacillota bacterium]
MLWEHITHYRNLHFAIGFSNVSQEAPHCHKEAEIALVLRGTVNYKIYHQDFHAEAGDVIVVDTRDLHYIYSSSEDVILLTFYIDMAAFSDIYPNIEYMIFVCEAFKKDPNVKHQKLRNKITFLAHHMAEMMVMYTQGDTSDKKLTSKLHEILYMMVNQFQGFFIENNEFRYSDDNANPVNLERLARIINYIETNYDKKITLSDLAEEEHLNMYHISHLIKDTTGLNFQNLLNYMRLEVAAKLLNEEKMTLTQISEACGFSSSSYFNKCFKEWYGITPAQYRKELRPDVRIYHGSIDYSEAMQLLRPYLDMELPERHESERFSSSNHIFIPLKKHYTDEQQLTSAFPLKLRISSEKELINLVYCKEELAALKPEAVSVPSDIELTSESQRTIFELKKAGLQIRFDDKSYDDNTGYYNDISTAAKVFDEIIRKPDAEVGVFYDDVDRTSGLFTRSYLPTPLCSIYKIFADIDGCIVEHQEQYLLIKERDMFHLLIHNSQESTKLNVHLRFSSAEKPAYIIRTEFGRNHSIFSIQNEIGTAEASDQRIREHVINITSGTRYIISADRLSAPNVDLIIEPDTLAVLTFRMKLPL